LHHAVLLDEAIDGLAIKVDGRYIDGTFGRGGHSAAILQCLGQNGHLLAIDKDSAAIEYAQKKFSEDPRFQIEQGSFAQLSNLVKKNNWDGVVDGILLDLGVSSPQLDEAARGFSFRKEGPLDMRMDTRSGRTAADWLQVAREKDLTTVLKEYGEERFARRIARAIVSYRRTQVLKTTSQLSELISSAVPTREKGKHPATRSFQAIRIYINSELDELKTCLEQALSVLSTGGRLVVISFHSLEDSIVKRFFRRQVKGVEFPRNLPITDDKQQSTVRSVGKAIHASEEEKKSNPRSRSAILRVVEKL